GNDWSWQLNDDNRRIGSTRIKTFICPSAPDMFRAERGVGYRGHIGHTPNLLDLVSIFYGDTFVPSSAPFATLGRTNYAGIAGMVGRGTNTSVPGLIPNGGLSKYEGLFTNRSQNSIDRIRDGTSNTLMFGEATGGTEGGCRSLEYGAAWMGFACFATAFGMSPHQGSTWYHLSSAHAGVVNFCFADASVRGLRAGSSKVENLGALLQLPPDEPGQIDYWVLQQLAGFQDGGTRPTDGILGN